LTQPTAQDALNNSGIAVRNLVFVLFAISGFSGLIYESVWTQYLKLLLGHAALAQTLVLTIFMGGMALGAWLAARYTVKLPNLLLSYAIVEVVIGLAGITFHGVFNTVTEFAYNSVMPALGDRMLVDGFKWGLASLLVAPQSILLGMTFPLMSGALVRRFPSESGGAIATLYFSNSLGAVAGVLVSGFWLIPQVGLPGAVLGAGLLNVLLALVVWLLAKQTGWASDAAASEPPVVASTSPVQPVALLLAVALVTGCASFIYEIGWIRMLSMVLGASTHAFELMLAAFILGLSLGALWIRARIDTLRDPVSCLGIVQLLMGVLALGTLVIYGSTFELMEHLMSGLKRNIAGYGLFNLSSHFIALLVMLPVTFCAGMTLPLITHVLLKGGAGERAIGHVYAANTVGAIAGVMLAVHLLMPLLGLKLLICVGAGLDIVAGAVLLLWANPAAKEAITRSSWRTGIRYGPIAAGTAALVAAVLVVELDAKKMVSGVFRYGRLDRVERSEVIYHADGKTATVDLVEFPDGVVGILTNGKTDATIQMREGAPASTDELAMTMVGALPVAANPKARYVAVIGFGAGMTTHTVLGSSNIVRVDTIEIEPKMVDAARHYRTHVSRAFDDPRSNIVYADARTFFSSDPARYDLIISEPSNPWVSGIATLFTEEFYLRAHASLADDGLFVQWIHGLEISLSLIGSVVKALGNAFDDYALYNLNGRDLMFIAGPKGKVHLDSGAVLSMPQLRDDMAKVGAKTARDLRVRYLGSRATMEPLLVSYPPPANSDYFPVLDVGAVRARFMRQDALALLALRRLSLPILDMLEPHRQDPRLAPMTITDQFIQSTAVHAGKTFVASLGTGYDEWARTMPTWLESLRVKAELVWPTCGVSPFERSWHETALEISRNFGSLLTKEEMDVLTQAMRTDQCPKPNDPLQIIQIDLLCAIADRDAQAMVATARQGLLEEAIHPYPDLRDYFLKAAILGEVAQGRYRQALELYEQHTRRSVESVQDVELRLLLTLAQTRESRR
jgi:spermidine synthase